MVNDSADSYNIDELQSLERARNTRETKTVENSETMAASEGPHGGEEPRNPKIRRHTFPGRANAGFPIRSASSSGTWINGAALSAGLVSVDGDWLTYHQRSLFNITLVSTARELSGS